MNNLDKDNTGAKERVSWEKLRSIDSLLFGERANHFDALLNAVPVSDVITVISEIRQKPEIGNVIFDVDGTLVPPYAPITDDVIERLRSYQAEGRKTAIYTNSPHGERLDVLEKAGVQIARTGRGKPSLEGFRILCEQCEMDPAHTAMIGNSPITDMPLVKDGEKPFFPLNILVESIPPQRKLVESAVKYYRARLFHMIATAAAGVVKLKNPNILRSVSLSD